MVALAVAVGLVTSARGGVSFGSVAGVGPRRRLGGEEEKESARARVCICVCLCVCLSTICKIRSDPLHMIVVLGQV